jgi:anti-anti-sigma factor
MDGGGATGGLQVAASEVDGIQLLRLTGEFDMAGVDSFERQLERGRAPEQRTLVLDLRGLRFIDSSGLRAVVIADQQARDAGRRCVVVRGPERVSRVLELTGVAERLEIVEDFPGIPPPAG